MTAPKRLLLGAHKLVSTAAKPHQPILPTHSLRQHGDVCRKSKAVLAHDRDRDTDSIAVCPTLLRNRRQQCVCLTLKDGTSFTASLRSLARGPFFSLAEETCTYNAAAHRGAVSSTLSALD